MYQHQHHHECVVVPVSAGMAVKPLLTDSFTLHDFCQFVVVGSECECQVDIPSDPNTGQRARFVTFVPVKGDYTVSITGATDFSHVGVNCPLLNPAGFDLTGISDLRVFSMSGAMVKVCWYRSMPRGFQADRSPLNQDANFGFSTSIRDATL
ncbi:hypothetical protein [Thiothrix winogradskyi]|uniref:Uncharacterized protein n=1 Tax=Thiothrix winogradskyi TaxID=96472 RepID=A0ABY3T4G1_9GAMM|nr:hypothetical protein [Thiothrix winogradskyi]UJS26275.1 hypothetical protein L2Y54_09610 [Thiothrix winogradskyi]